MILLVITDGRRDCIENTIHSATDNLSGNITYKVIYDDSGDDENRQWLKDTFPEFEILWHPGGRQGFGGAIRTAWQHLAHRSEKFVFHLEDDFIFNRPVPLYDLAGVLSMNCHLVQMALRRQPWNDEERAAGGIVEQHPEDYVQRSDFMDRTWLEHRRFFTTNPSVYRTSLCRDYVWPSGPNSEGMFTHLLLEDPNIRFGYWGSKESGEAVTHIGYERVGSGY